MHNLIVPAVSDGDRKGLNAAALGLASKLGNHVVLSFLAGRGVEQHAAALRKARSKLMAHATVRQASGMRSRSVFLITLEQNGHGRFSWSSARVQLAHVMLCPQG